MPFCLSVHLFVCRDGFFSHDIAGFGTIHSNFLRLPHTLTFIQFEISKKLCCFAFAVFTAMSVLFDVSM